MIRLLVVGGILGDLLRPASALARVYRLVGDGMRSVWPYHPWTGDERVVKEKVEGSLRRIAIGLGKEWS
jgi:hypothetical protein